MGVRWLLTQGWSLCERRLRSVGPTQHCSARRCVAAHPLRCNQAERARSVNDSMHRMHAPAQAIVGGRPDGTRVAVVLPVEGRRWQLILCGYAGGWARGRRPLPRPAPCSTVQGSRRARPRPARMCACAPMPCCPSAGPAPERALPPPWPWPPPCRRPPSRRRGRVRRVPAVPALAAGGADAGGAWRAGQAGRGTRERVLLPARRCCCVGWPGGGCRPPLVSPAPCPAWQPLVATCCCAPRRPARCPTHAAGRHAAHASLQVQRNPQPAAPVRAGAAAVAARGVHRQSAPAAVCPLALLPAASAAALQLPTARERHRAAALVPSRHCFPIVALPAHRCPPDGHAGGAGGPGGRRLRLQPDLC